MSINSDRTWIITRAARLGDSIQSYLERLRSSLTFFAEELWANRGLDKYAELGEIERDILDWIQFGPNKSGVLAPRGFGKTHLVTATVTCWDLLRDPNWKILIVSKSEGEAKKTLRLIRDWIDNIPFLQHLAPGQDDRDSATQFDVAGCKPSRDPSVSAKGIEGQLAGNRAHRAIGDDIETPTNTKTIDAREDLLTSASELDSIASYGDRRETYVGTFHHEESVYIKLNNQGVQFRTWPLLYPKPDQEQLNLAPLLADRLSAGEAQPGDIVAPYRFDMDYVLEKQAKGQTHFAMQHMLVANMGDTLLYPLCLSDLIVFDEMARDQAPISIKWGRNNGQGQSTKIEDLPMYGFTHDALHRPILYDSRWVDYNRTVLWVDPSGRGEDKTSWAIVSQSSGYLWAHRVASTPGGHELPALEQIAQDAQRYRVNEVHVEDFALQSMFAQLLEPIIKRHFLEPNPGTGEGQWRCPVILTRPAAMQKELRIIGSLEPVMNQHRLVVSREVVESESLQHQLTRVTRQRNSLPHDDELDALAAAVALFSADMAVDPEKAAQRQRDKDRQDELKKYWESTDLELVDSEPRWFKHRST